MTIFAHLACAPVADNVAREPESNSFRRARRSSVSSSAETDHTGKLQEEPEYAIRRLKYERDLLKHQLTIANRQKEELSLQVQGMRYSSSCPSFPRHMAASPRGIPLSPNRSVSSPLGYLHSAPMDEAGAELLSGEDILIPASYPDYSFGAIAVYSAASSPSPGMRYPGSGMYGSYSSSTTLLDIQRARLPLHVNTGIPRSRGTTPPLSPQQTSPNLSVGGTVMDALDSIASSCSETIRSDLQMLGLDLDELDHPDRKRADELQAEVERLQRILEVEQQERRGLDCRIRELEHVIDALKQENEELAQQASCVSSKSPFVASPSGIDTDHSDRTLVRDQDSAAA